MAFRLFGPGGTFAQAAEGSKPIGLDVLLTGEMFMAAHELIIRISTGKHNPVVLLG